MLYQLSYRSMPLEAITYALVSSTAILMKVCEQLHTTSDVKPPPHSSPTTVGTWMTSAKGQQLLIFRP